MNKEKRNMVRWADGTYDPYHIPGHKKVWFDRNGSACELLSDEVATSKSYSDFAENLPSDEEGSLLESPLANTDLMRENDDTGSPFNEGVDDIRHDAYLALTTKQQKVWDLCMRDGLTEQEAADALSITQQAIHKHLTGAKTRYTNYLREHGEELGGSF